MNTNNATTGATLSMLPDTTEGTGVPLYTSPTDALNAALAGTFAPTNAQLDLATANTLAADANADPLNAIASPIDAAGNAITGVISNATGITSAGTNTFLNSLSNLLGSTAQTLQWLIIGIAVVVVIWFAFPFLEGIRDK